MDDKKQALTPELKQIYERVMNTPSASSAPTTPAPPVVLPQTPPPAATAPSQTQQTIPATPPSAQTTTAPVTNTIPSLPSSQPRPLNDTGTSKPFVFTADVKKPGSTQQPIDTDRAVMAKKEGKKLSGKVIILLVVVLVIVWSVFWAKFFKFF